MTKEKSGDRLSLWRRWVGRAAF